MSLRPLFASADAGGSGEAPVDTGQFCALICPGRPAAARPWMGLEKRAILALKQIAAEPTGRPGLRQVQEGRPQCRSCFARVLPRLSFVCCPCLGGIGAAVGRTVLQGQDRRPDHRLSARRLERHLCACARPSSRQAHPGTADRRGEEHAGRRQLPGASTTSTPPRPRMAPSSPSARRRLRSTSGSARRTCASRPPSSAGSGASIRSSISCSCGTPRR